MWSEAVGSQAGGGEEKKSKGGGQKKWTVSSKQLIKKQTSPYIWRGSRLLLHYINL